MALTRNCKTLPQTVRSTPLFKAENSKSDKSSTRSQIGRDLWAIVKMCTPVHGLSGFSKIELIAKSPCIGVHIYTLAPQVPSNLASVPILYDFDFSALISYLRRLPEPHVCIDTHSSRFVLNIPRAIYRLNRINPYRGPVGFFPKMRNDLRGPCLPVEFSFFLSR